MSVVTKRSLHHVSSEHVTIIIIPVLLLVTSYSNKIQTASQLTASHSPVVKDSSLSALVPYCSITSSGLMGNMSTKHLSQYIQTTLGDNYASITSSSHQLYRLTSVAYDVRDFSIHFAITATSGIL